MIIKDMITFIKKIIPTVVRTSGKKVSGKVIWKKTGFIVKVQKQYFEIDGRDNLTNIKWLYALPINPTVESGTRKLYVPITDPFVFEMTLRFWSKYWQGMTIYGKVINNIFYPVKHRDNNQF